MPNFGATPPNSMIGRNHYGGNPNPQNMRSMGPNTMNGTTRGGVPLSPTTLQRVTLQRKRQINDKSSAIEID